MTILPAIYRDDASGIPHYMGLTGRKLGLAVSIVATNGFLLFGYDQGVMSGIISAKPFNTAFPETRDNATYQGFVTAIYEIGCLFGAIFILALGDRIGRRRAIILGGFVMVSARATRDIERQAQSGEVIEVPSGGADSRQLTNHDVHPQIIGTIIQVTAIPGHGATAQFIVGRVVTGLGNGVNTATIPTYQAECARTTNRGLLICIQGGIIAFGTLIAYVHPSFSVFDSPANTLHRTATGSTSAPPTAHPTSPGASPSPSRSSLASSSAP